MSVLKLGEFALVCTFLVACSPVNPSAKASSPAHTFSILIPIQAEKFSKLAVVRVSLWNSAQLAIEENNPPCVVSHSAGSTTETIQCPPGKTYTKVTPEEFTFPIGEAAMQITINSYTVKMGEKFKIIVYGLSADDCNGRSASFTGMADSETILLKDLLWSTTEMACVKIP
jgi:hypothetical protein